MHATNKLSWFYTKERIFKFQCARAPVIWVERNLLEHVVFILKMEYLNEDMFDDTNSFITITH